MNPEEKYEMIEKENQMLRAELRETLDELSRYRDTYGELRESRRGEKKMDLKKFINESKEKIQGKLKDEKVKDKVEKGKVLSDKAKKKVFEGSNIAIDAFQSAKKVLFNKELKESLKDEFENRRKQRQEKE